MAFQPPKGWERESDTLFIHATGVRIERRVYREKEGWFLIPADLDQEVLGFDPTPEGRDQAFAAFAEGKLKPARKAKSAAAAAGAAANAPAKPRRGRPPKPRPEPEPGEAEAEEEEAGDEDEEDED
jgi:mannose/cellobiose epimerase-like protein (N-acyl-D-glucosamine 2-epimerase family)